MASLDAYSLGLSKLLGTGDSPIHAETSRLFFDNPGIAPPVDSNSFENMSYYIILWNFADQGIKSLKDCLQSIEIFKGYTKRRGNPFHGTYYSFDSMTLCHW